MKHCFEKIDVDQVKFLFNGKTAGLAHFYFWKKEKFLLVVINQEFTNLKQKYNNNKMYPVRNYISYSLYYIDN